MKYVKIALPGRDIRTMFLINTIRKPRECGEKIVEPWHNAGKLKVIEIQA